MITARALAPIVVCAVGLVSGYFVRPLVDQGVMPEAMPVAVVAAEQPAVRKSSDVPVGTIRVTKIEVVDPSGKLQMILTSENGVPIIIVNDNGRARKVDLAWLARKFG